MPATPQLTPGQASYVIGKLISDRRVSAGEVNRYISDMQREIGDLERRLQELRSASSGGGRAEAGAAAPRRRGRPAGAKTGAARAGRKAKPAATRARRRKITAEQLASRQLQGRYLGLIRQIPANKRAQYQKIAKDRGREAAIKEMSDTLKK